MNILFSFVEFVTYLEQVAFQTKLENAINKLASLINASTTDANVVDEKATRILGKVKAADTSIDEAELQKLIGLYEYMCIKSKSLATDVNSAIVINKHDDSAEATVAVSKNLLDTVERVTSLLENITKG